jgi:glutamate racemase
MLPVAKIGVLDSGVGGLSVLREIHRLLPNHPTLYFADQGHLPYGPRDAAEISGFVEAIARFLISYGAAAIVIACNAASAAGLQDLRAQYPHIPIVGMEPAVKPAAEATKSGVIGVLTTQATANGSLYKRVLAQYAQDVRVITQITPELVWIVEDGSQDTTEGRATIRRYIQPLLDAGADQIALACTHFPFLSEAIQAVVGPGVQLIDPGPAIARQTARVWPADLTVTPSANAYFTSGLPENLTRMLRTLVGIDALVTAVSWSAQDGNSVGCPETVSVE